MSYYGGRPPHPPSTYSQPVPREGSDPHLTSWARVSPTLTQPQQLPSLSSWAASGATAAVPSHERSLEPPRPSRDRSSHLIGARTPPAAATDNRSAQDSASYRLAQANQFARAPQGDKFDELPPTMCFRDRSYATVEREEQARLMAEPRMAPPTASWVPHGAKAHYTPLASEHQMPGFMGSTAAVPKRQAHSPAPQPPQQKRNREVDFTHKRAFGRSVELVPNILGPEKADIVRSLKFSLKIRQQPEKARSCGFADKDRRAIDPPPIVELVIEGDGLSADDQLAYMRLNRILVFCKILDEAGLEVGDMKQHSPGLKRMVGSTTGEPFVGTDEHGDTGCFHVFNDLSCRTPGHYRLLFSAYYMPLKEQALAGTHYKRIVEVASDVFIAYNAKMFPGMTESSPLAKALKEQGCNISVRKGNERSKDASHRNAGRQDESDGGSV